MARGWLAMYIAASWRIQLVLMLHGDGSSQNTNRRTILKAKAYIGSEHKITSSLHLHHVVVVITREHEAVRPAARLSRQGICWHSHGPHPRT